jgi:hypothetical protein
MKERAEELHALVLELPRLVGRVVDCSEEALSGVAGRELFKEEQETDQRQRQGESSSSTNFNDELAARLQIAKLQREIHRCLDQNDVHGAAVSLIALFDIIAGWTAGEGGDGRHYYPLATALSSVTAGRSSSTTKPPPPPPPSAILETQMKMVYLHVQTLPSRTVKLARRVLLQSAAREGGTHITAAALSALDLLNVDRNNNSNQHSSTRAAKLIDLYYDSKAQLLNRLLNRLTLPSSTVSAADATSVTNAAEIILSEIVLILQHDVILDPYQIFVLRKFPLGGVVGKDDDAVRSAKVIHDIMSTLPHFDADLLKSKASRFLAAHLPLIRTKVKSVLMIIAGTTASKLGQIRQTLYDKTDGVECMAALDGSGVCSWEEAVGGMVDIRVVSHGTSFGASGKGEEQEVNSSSNGHSTQSSSQGGSSRRFSLWGALFSNTFSSLVHSLLTSSFHSVHVRVVSTLRTSLARAPPFESMLPHEAHRNALRIATDLDASLRKVSDDAHELLVHAEEREESERRLRQSLYVQTCEIMGRLLNELRRMLVVAKHKSDGVAEDATREFIVGRLCHLLKFRLKSLPTLLDPNSSPAVLAAGLGGGKSSGMITLMELRSSFDLADDDDDGLISFDEAMEAMESAFSGTHFRGAEMVRDTLLLSQSSSAVGTAASGVPSGGNKSAPPNVTLSELALLSARGLRHDSSGPESALGTVQTSLDKIVNRCFGEWARAALSPSLKSFTTGLHKQIGVASTVSDVEWRRLNGLIEKEDDILLREIHDTRNDNNNLSEKQTVVGQVSSHVMSYLLAVSAVLNRSVCPVDSLPPVPSPDYAEMLGISLSEKRDIANMQFIIRGSLLGEALTSLSASLQRELASDEDGGATDQDETLQKCSPSSLIQILMDVQFINRCFFERNCHGFLLTADAGESDYVEDSRRIIDHLSEHLSQSVKLATSDGSSISSAILERHAQVFSSCNLFLSSLFGEDESDTFSASNSASMNGVGGSSVVSSLNPLASSRRFVLLPIQAEKSLTELQLRGKYSKKNQEEKASSTSAMSGNALGTGFGFLSSMLSTKTR